MYLKFLNKLIKNSNIYEGVDFAYFRFNKLINLDDLIVKNLEVEKFLVSIDLNGEYSLLILDFPINFLLSYSIFIGEDSNLYAFEYEGKKCIAEKSLMEKLGIEDFSTSVLVKDLFSKEFDLSFGIEIVDEIKNYCLEILNLNFNQIHIVSGSNVELFTPNLSEKHLILAKKLKIPTLNLIDNGFIRDSNINVFDVVSSKDLIKPILNFKELSKVYFDSDLNPVYSDLNLNYYIHYDKDLLLKKLDDVDVTNVDLDEIKLNLSNLSNNFCFTSNSGLVPLPIWRVTSLEKFVSIEGVEHFKQITGVNFKLDFEWLDHLYIIGEEGNEGVFASKFISSDFENAVLSISNNLVIEYDTDEELLLKLLFCDEVKAVVKREKVLDKNVLDFQNLIVKFFDLIKKKSIKFNLIPKQNTIDSNFEKLLFAEGLRLEEEIENFMLSPKRNQFLKISKLNLKNTIDYLNRKISNDNELYFVIGIFKFYLVIFGIYDNSKSKDILDEFEGLFKEVDFVISDIDKKKFAKFKGDFLKKISKKISK